MEQLNNLRIVGPLTLDSGNNTAYIVPHAELRLNSEEFEVLYMLAIREDIPLSFEQITDCLWEWNGSEGGEAREIVAKVAGQVNAAGNGFVWIEQYAPSSCMFRTKWSHNREKWQPVPTSIRGGSIAG